VPSSFALLVLSSLRSTSRRQRSAGDSVRLTSFVGQLSNATLHLPLLLQGRGNQLCDSTDRLGRTFRDGATTGFHGTASIRRLPARYAPLESSATQGANCLRWLGALNWPIVQSVAEAAQATPTCE
jgi:hypothetical protein